MVTKDEIQNLLKSGESCSLDWKRDFPPALLRGKRDPDWDKARGTVLKDLVAIANGDSPYRGHLVYGVEDEGTARNVVGISKSWDDATFQTWAENTFEPVLKFSYSEIEWTHTQAIGVFQIERVSEYPHVVISSIGGVLFDGQVWFRRGTKNLVAHRADLQRMLVGDEPFKIGNLPDPELDKVTVHYKEQGREVCMPRFSERDSRLAAGYELARYPGTRREVWVGYHRGEYEHILMVKPAGK